MRSAVREAVCAAAGSTTVRFEDDNERRYKTIPFHPSAVEGTSSDLNWGYQNKVTRTAAQVAPRACRLLTRLSCIPPVASRKDASGVAKRLAIPCD